MPARACVDQAFGELFRRDRRGQQLFDRALPTWHPDVDDLFDPLAASFDFDDPLDGLWGRESSDDGFDVDEARGPVGCACLGCAPGDHSDGAF